MKTLFTIMAIICFITGFFNPWYFLFMIIFLFGRVIAKEEEKFCEQDKRRPSRYIYPKK